MGKCVVFWTIWLFQQTNARIVKGKEGGKGVKGGERAKEWGE